VSARLVTFTIEAVMDEGAVDELTWEIEAATFMSALQPGPNAENQLIGDVECVYVTGRVSMPT
jgi:hypothetical protein